MNGVLVYIGKRIGEIREYYYPHLWGRRLPVERVLVNVRIGPRPVYRYRWPEVANAD